jgi:hypothetical protein
MRPHRKSIKHCITEAYWGVDVSIHIFLISELAGGKWSAWRTGRFIPRERASSIHWIGGWVGLRAGLYNVERKFLTLPGLELRPLDRPACSQSLYRLRFSGERRRSWPILKYYHEEKHDHVSGQPVSCRLHRQRGRQYSYLTALLPVTNVTRLAQKGNSRDREKALPSHYEYASVQTWMAHIRKHDVYNEHIPILYLTSKRKATRIFVTGRGGPQGCEMSRLPHFLDNRLTDGGEVVSLQRRPPYTPEKIPDIHFF